MRFDNGLSMICLYPGVDVRPNCAFRAVPSAIPLRPYVSEDW